MKQEWRTPREIRKRECLSPMQKAYEKLTATVSKPLSPGTAPKGNKAHSSVSETLNAL